MSDPHAAGNGTTRPLIIAGLQFAVADVYSAGHTIDDAEAHVLNQTRRENLRNNFASKVEKEKEAAQKEGRPVDVAALQEEFNKYAEEYEFGIRSGTAGPKADPVTVEMRAIARALVREGIKAKGHKLSSVGAEVQNRLIDEFLAKHGDKIREKAEAVVAARSSLSELSINV